MSVQIADRVNRKYKAIETIVCVKKELSQQMHPTLFESVKNKEFAFIELCNNGFNTNR